jgi:hypothetical protein
LRLETARKPSRVICPEAGHSIIPYLTTAAFRQQGRCFNGSRKPNHSGCYCYCCQTLIAATTTTRHGYLQQAIPSFTSDYYVRPRASARAHVEMKLTWDIVLSSRLDLLRFSCIHARPFSLSSRTIDGDLYVPKAFYSFSPSHQCSI